MSEENDAENPWKPKVDALHREFSAILNLIYDLRDAGKMDLWDQGDICGALNKVAIDDGGLELFKTHNDAAGYALFRHGLHAMRAKFVELHPELADVLNERVPPGRSL